MKIFNLQDETHEDDFQCHNDCVNSVAVTRDNKFIISGGYDKTVRIWNLRDSTQQAVLFSNSSIYNVAITNDNKYIVAGNNKTVLIWNIRDKIKVTALSNARI